jgi:hypothetical protein
VATGISAEPTASDERYEVVAPVAPGPHSSQPPADRRTPSAPGERASPSPAAGSDVPIWTVPRGQRTVTTGLHLVFARGSVGAPNSKSTTFTEERGGET